MSIPKQFLLSLFRILCGVPIVSLLGLGLLFVLLSVTWQGRCVGLSAVLLGGLLFCSVGYWDRPWFRTRRRRFFTALIPASAFLVLIPMALAPDGGNEEACVRNCYLGDANKFPRYSPWNVIPEVDQMSVGLHLLPLGDPYVNAAKGRRMRSLVLPTYARMKESPAFHRLGSVRGTACRDLLRMNFRTGHYYLFMPHTTPDERVPCLVFLHGMGGNIKPYFWALSKISTRMNCAVVAPTFGMGFWQKDGAAEFVTDVTREVKETFPVDPNEVFLMGYSQGAVGVTKAAVLEPGLYRGLIYLSPIIEDDLLGSAEFESQKEDLRLLFLHGRNDSRIPCDFVKGTARTLRANWLRRGDARIYDGEDHYLILSPARCRATGRTGPIHDRIASHGPSR